MSKKARVLFVDDEERVLNSMRGMFRREFDLFLAANGEAAVNIASRNQIDVIVADQRMPGMSGTEVLGKVKELSPDTIRILLTGYADPAAVESSINFGEVFRFLGKPCPPKVLRHTLDVAVKAAKIAPTETPAKSRVASAPAGKDAAGNRAHASTPTPSRLPDAPPYIRLANKESVNTPTRPQVVAGEVGVVLYTVDAHFAEAAIRAVSLERNTMLATSLIKVMQLMEKQSTGVLVTDVTSNDTRLQGIIGALKRSVPELVTIVVSDNSDTTDMINLINGGQIYRYLRKPVTPIQLRTEIGAAATKHLALRNNDNLAKRHSVATLPGQYQLSIEQVNTLTRMHELRSRQASANGGYY